MALSVLKIEIDELKNSIQHLERSNRELKDLLQTDPDPEYRLAIGDNITTIAKKRARVAALEEELRRLTGEEYDSDCVAVPVSEDAAGATGQEATRGGATASAVTDAQIEESHPQEDRAGEPASGMDVDVPGPGASAATASGIPRDARGTLSVPVAVASAAPTGMQVSEAAGVEGGSGEPGGSGMWL